MTLEYEAMQHVAAKANQIFGGEHSAMRFFGTCVVNVHGRLLIWDDDAATFLLVMPKLEGHPHQRGNGYTTVHHAINTSADFYTALEVYDTTIFTPSAKLDLNEALTPPPPRMKAPSRA